MKIDAHQHFWIYDQKEYSWINDNMSILKRDCLPDDLAKEIIPLGIIGKIGFFIFIWVQILVQNNGEQYGNLAKSSETNSNSIGDYWGSIYGS